MFDATSRTPRDASPARLVTPSANVQSPATAVASVTHLSGASSARYNAMIPERCYRPNRRLSIRRQSNQNSSPGRPVNSSLPSLSERTTRSVISSRLSSSSAIIKGRSFSTSSGVQVCAVSAASTSSLAAS